MTCAPATIQLVLLAVALSAAAKPQSTEIGEGRPLPSRFAEETADSSWPPAPVLDSRYIASTVSSVVMLERAYLDQPYCVVSSAQQSNQSSAGRGEGGPACGTEGGDISRWICVITSDKLHEGGTGEHVVSIYSEDNGKTWSQPVALEPDSTMANAYATIALTDFGRVYAMYNFNADNITKLPDGTALGREDELGHFGRVWALYNYNADNVTVLPDGKPLTRTDTLGHFVMKYSDDRGETWSKERYEVPYRLTSIDTNNSFHGKVKIMWSVDQTKRDTLGTVYYSFTKIGIYPQNAPEEVWFLASDNILTEKDASKVTWRLLPDGDHGLPPPGGNPNIAEEGHIMPLPNGYFYAVFRTTQGLLAACSTVGASASKWHDCTTVFAQYERSIDNGPAYLKNPRGPITMKKFSNGRYLLLYYNNGGTGFLEEADYGQAASVDMSRNPYWLSAGIATDSGDILWSQPEIIIYDRVFSRPGYPDFIEVPSTGQIFITETQKTIARIHEISSILLQKLWVQESSTAVAEDFAAHYTNSSHKTFSMATLPSFGNFSRQDGYIQGFTLIFWLSPLTEEKETLMTAYEHDYHKGIGLEWQNQTVNFTASDAAVLVSCTTDSVCSKRLQNTDTNLHQLAVTVDGGPMMITLAVDGVLCDGAKDRVRGSCWMNNQIRDVNGLANATVGQSVNRLLLYNRALFNSEVVANYNNATRPNIE